MQDRRQLLGVADAFTMRVIEGAAIVDLPERGGSVHACAADLPLHTLVDLCGH